jgi:hypothetical protein
LPVFAEKTGTILGKEETVEINAIRVLHEIRRMNILVLLAKDG